MRHAAALYHFYFNQPYFGQLQTTLHEKNSTHPDSRLIGMAIRHSDTEPAVSAFFRHQLCRTAGRARRAPGGPRRGEGAGARRRAE